MADLQTLPLEQLAFNPWNPNTMKASDFKRLVKEIQEVGFIDAPQVIPMDDGTFRVIGGEHRIRAAQELGYTEVPCMVLSDERWKDEDLQKLVTVRLNVLHGKLDPSRMASLYDEMAKKYGQEALQEVFAYTDTREWKNLVKSLGKAVEGAGLDKDKAREFKEKAREARTVDDLTRILQQLFANYGDTVAHSFMVFTHGNQEHIYVNLDKKTHGSMKKVMKFCLAEDLNINKVLGVAVQALADSLKSSKKKEKTSPRPDDVKF